MPPPLSWYSLNPSSRLTYFRRLRGDDRSRIPDSYAEDEYQREFFEVNGRKPKWRIQPKEPKGLVSHIPADTLKIKDPVRRATVICELVLEEVQKLTPQQILELRAAFVTSEHEQADLIVEILTELLLEAAS